MWSRYDLFPHDGWSSWSAIAPFYKPGRTLGSGPASSRPDSGHALCRSVARRPRCPARARRAVRAGDNPLPFPTPALIWSACLRCWSTWKTTPASCGGRAGPKPWRQAVFLPGKPAVLDPTTTKWSATSDATAAAARARHRRRPSHRKVCAINHDRMDGWFGAVFGFGTKYLDASPRTNRPPLPAAGAALPGVERRR